MSNLTQLRLAAREIFEEALGAVDAGAAVRNTVRVAGSSVAVCDKLFELKPQQFIYSIAIGKAAVPMAIALEAALGERFVEGVIAGPASRASSSKPKPGNRWGYFEGGHPLPDANSLAAASEAFALLKRANEEHALVVFLVSGGGSAMIEWPISEDISLQNLRAANRALVKCGASITEINSVRRAFSAVKGGRLAGHAPDCEQITLIVSDVPRGEERNVASGPTLAPSHTPDPRNVIARYDLGSKLPRSIVQAIENATPPNQPSDALRQHFVLLDNGDAIESAAQAARQAGFMTEIAKDISDQPIEEGCKQLLKRLDTVRVAQSQDRLESELVPPVRTSADCKQNDSAGCLISGGEFACPVRGDGMGGRNLETALRLAIEADRTEIGARDFVALCAGTDGIDGNSPAAGAIVDSTTINRARKIGLDPLDFLNRSDAYSFFVALGDAITTGVTGTNVRDLRILLWQR
jgi:glycerate 2-kinase